MIAILAPAFFVLPAGLPNSRRYVAQSLPDGTLARMDGSDDSDNERKRDRRTWLELTRTRNQLTARMTCTYLEEAGVEARVRTQDGHYCVEVPEYQFDDALLACEPADSNIVPAMTESQRQTDMHVPPPLQESLKNPKQLSEEERLTRAAVILRWTFRIIVILILIALLLIVFIG